MIILEVTPGQYYGFHKLMRVIDQYSMELSAKEKEIILIVNLKSIFGELPALLMLIHRRVHFIVVCGVFSIPNDFIYYDEKESWPRRIDMPERYDLRGYLPSIEPVNPLRCGVLRDEGFSDSGIIGNILSSLGAVGRENEQDRKKPSR